MQLIRNLVTLLPQHPTLGLIAGSRYHLHTFGLWGYAVISSPDMMGAINMATRMFSQTLLLTRLRTERLGQHLVSSFEADHLPVDVRQFLSRPRQHLHPAARCAGPRVATPKSRMQRAEPAPRWWRPTPSASVCARCSA